MFTSKTVLILKSSVKIEESEMKNKIEIQL